MIGMSHHAAIDPLPPRSRAKQSMWRRRAPAGPIRIAGDGSISLGPVTFTGRPADILACLAARQAVAVSLAEIAAVWGLAGAGPRADWNEISTLLGQIAAAAERGGHLLWEPAPGWYRLESAL